MRAARINDTIERLKAHMREHFPDSCKNRDMRDLEDLKDLVLNLKDDVADMRRVQLELYRLGAI